MKKKLKSNSGRVFESLKSSDKSPSFIGRAMVQGKEWRIALWENRAKNGNRYLNIDFEEPWVWIDDEKS